MVITFLFLIFTAAVYIDCQENKNFTKALKNSGDGREIKEALARMESTMKTSVADLRNAVVVADLRAAAAVADLRTSVAELRTKVIEDASDLASKLKSRPCENVHTESEHQKGRSPVAFTAHFSRDDQKNGITLGTHSILGLDKVETNIGGGYNPNTGIFTAPVNGLYVFFLSIMGAQEKRAVCVDIVTQNKVLDRIFVDGGRFYQASGLVTTNMTAGQELYARQGCGEAVRGGWWTVFSGYLL